MSGKSEEEKTLELMVHLDRDAFEEFFEKLWKDGKLTEEENDFRNVKKSLTQHFVKKEGPRDVIRRAVDGGVNLENILDSLKSTGEFY